MVEEGNGEEGGRRWKVGIDGKLWPSTFRQVQHPAVSATLLAHARGIHLKRKSPLVASRRTFHLFEMRARRVVIVASPLPTTTLSAQSRGLCVTLPRSSYGSYGRLPVSLIPVSRRNHSDYFAWRGVVYRYTGNFLLARQSVRRYPTCFLENKIALITIVNTVFI